MYVDGVLVLWEFLQFVMAGNMLPSNAGFTTIRLESIFLIKYVFNQKWILIKKIKIFIWVPLPCAPPPPFIDLGRPGDTFVVAGDPTI